MLTTRVACQVARACCALGHLTTKQRPLAPPASVRFQPEQVSVIAGMRSCGAARAGDGRPHRRVSGNL
jgi:hypothetical protein